MMFDAGIDVGDLTADTPPATTLAAVEPDALPHALAMVVTKRG